MSFQAAWFNCPAGRPVQRDGMVVGTAEDVAELVARLADSDADTATVYLSGTGVFADPPTIDHTVHVAVVEGRGYLSYWDMTHDLGFARGEPMSAGYLSEAEDFPVGSALTVADLTTALLELLVTGRRPTCVDWSAAVVR